jgi:heat shock protein HslJ
MKIPLLPRLQKGFFLIGLLFVLSACPDKNRKALEETIWELEETALGGKVKSTTERPPSLQFSLGEGRFTGFGGCNQIMGSFELDKKKIRIGRIGGTKMNCPNMADENLFISSLHQVNRFKLEEGKLILLKDKSEVLVLSPQN